MDKKLSIAIIIAIIAVLAIAAFFVLNNSFIPESSQQTDLFDNIDIKVNFYKNNNLLDSCDSKIDSTKDGKFNLNFTKELSEEPDAFYYDVISATEV